MCESGRNGSPYEAKYYIYNIRTIYEGSGDNEVRQSQTESKVNKHSSKSQFWESEA